MRWLWSLVLAGCAVGFAWANARRASTWVRVALATFAAGALMNAVATALNGGMPFSVAGGRWPVAGGRCPRGRGAPPPSRRLGCTRS